MSGPTRTALVRSSVVTAGRAGCVVAVAGAVLALNEVLTSRAARGWLWFGATLLVAAAVVATRSSVERLADKVAFGRDGDPYSTLSDFVRRISETLAVDEVLPRVAQTVTQATHSHSSEVRLWLGDGAEWRESWPMAADPVTVPGSRNVVDVPLQHHGEQVGMVGVAPEGGTLTGGSRDQLDRLAGTAGLALANVRLTYDLRRRIAESHDLATRLDRSRQRLLDAAAGQRARFSFLVEAQVQTRLRAVGDALDQAEQAVPSGPDSAPDGALDRALDRATSALEALRDIARGVFPPTLTDSGLRVALDAFALRYDGRVRLRHESRGERLAPAVEAAAYFCAVQLIDDGAAAGGKVRVDIDQPPSGIRIRVSSDRAPSDETMQLVEDRVQATDGVLQRPRPDASDPAAGHDVVVAWAVGWETPAPRAPHPAGNDEVDTRS